MIEKNVENLLKEIPEYNKYGEKVTLVAAVKLQNTEDINRAVAAGIKDIGDNHVQEFREKYDGISGSPERHFIGHLQTNKIKYLLGKCNLYHSIDRMGLAEELSKRSLSAQVISNVLIQINIGNEGTKSGFDSDQAEDVYFKIKSLPNINVQGLMAMLPLEADESTLRELARKMREKYDLLNKNGAEFKHLSMGMSGDWRICIEEGSNMIRLGTAIFGARSYQNKNRT